MKTHAAALCLLAICPFGIPARAGAPVDGSLPNPTIPAVRVAVPPVIDGALDDACWAGAPVVTGFTHDTKPATLDTEVRVVYGASEAYFAFRCHDPEPSRLVAQQRKRNGGMDNDDYVAVGIDPLYDRNGAYWFRVNPLGTQSEEIPGGAASKVQWRGDWRAAAKVTSDGWTAELAVPFDILRYPKNQRVFGLMFERSLRRHLEGTNWPIRTFYYVHTNEARWMDIQPPRVARRPLVMPYALAATGSIHSNAGLDVKYTAETGATTLFTLRPDFATIEDVVQTIDFSYNPRWLSDRRPFFTEGGDFFGSSYGFYSRSIGKVDAGLKSFGKSGPFRYAGMAVKTPHDGSDAVGYLNYDPNPSWGVFAGGVAQRDGAVYNDDDVITGRSDNSVWHTGGHVWKALAVNGIGSNVDYYRSSTNGDAPGGSGHALRWNVDRYGGDNVPEYHFRVNQVSPNYTNRLAFLPEVGFRDVNADGGISRRYSRGLVRRAWYGGGVGQTDYWGGGHWHRGFGLNVDADLAGDAHMNVGLDGSERRNASTAAEARTALLFRDLIGSVWYGWRRSDSYRQGSLFVRTGRQAGGPYRFLEVHQGVRFSEKFSGGVDGSYVRVRGILDDVNVRRALFSAVYEITDERSLALRFIVGTDRSAFRDTPTGAWDPSRRSLTNAYVAYRQELRKGADIFVLAGDPDPATAGVKSQIAVKYVVTL